MKGLNHSAATSGLAIPVWISQPSGSFMAFPGSSSLFSALEFSKRLSPVRVRRRHRQAGGYVCFGTKTGHHAARSACPFGASSDDAGRQIKVRRLGHSQVDDKFERGRSLNRHFVAG